MPSLGPRGVHWADEASPKSTTVRKSFSQTMMGDMSPSVYDLTPSAYEAMDDSPRFRMGTEWTSRSAFGDQTPRFRVESMLTTVSAFGDDTPMKANSTDSISAFK